MNSVRMNVSSSNLMSSISCNVSAKAGDVEDGVKLCIQVDHEGVVHAIARLGFEGMVCLVNSKKKKAMKGGFRGEESKEKSQS